MNMQEFLSNFPFIAITRGIQPEEAVECAEVLHASDFYIIETPLNTPDSLLSIKKMADNFGDLLLIGAGTVTTIDQVEWVAKAGGRLIVSPHCDLEIIRATKAMDLISIPGVATPTEALSAISAGADALKLFPAEIITPQAVKAMRAILSPDIPLIPVGGICADNWQPYFQNGANGFGLGSSLYTKNIPASQLQKNAASIRESWKSYLRTE